MAEQTMQAARADPALQAALEAAEGTYRRSLYLEAPTTVAELDAEHKRCQDMAQAVFEAMSAAAEPNMRKEYLDRLMGAIQKHWAEVSAQKRTALHIKASEEALKAELAATRAQLEAERKAGEEARRKEAEAQAAQMAAMQQQMAASDHRMAHMQAAQMAAARRRRRIGTAVAVSHIAHNRRSRGQPGCSIQ